MLGDDIVVNKLTTEKGQNRASWWVALTGIARACTDEKSDKETSNSLVSGINESSVSPFVVEES